MVFEQGDIVLLNIPFTDFSSKKIRPVLVLSNTKLNQKTDDLIVAAITSNIMNKQKFSIDFTNKDLIDGHIKVPSCILTNKIFTISPKIVYKKIGKISPQKFKQVKRKLNTLFNLDS
jgi:mRNA interferase MazF